MIGASTLGLGVMVKPAFATLSGTSLPETMPNIKLAITRAKLQKYLDFSSFFHFIVLSLQLELNPKR